MPEKKPVLMKSSEAPHACLALRPREAAKALGIGQRLLWSMTNQGQIPHARIGRCVLYPVPDLEKWLAERAAKGTRS